MSNSDHQDPLYLELAHALALIIYGRCCAHEDTHAEYEHFNENRLDVPPDILSRLGVMRGTHPDQSMSSGRHVFENNWSPGKPLQLRRHAGEPSVFDLIIAVCLMVDWDRNVVSSLQKLDDPSLERLPTIDLKDHRRFQSESQIVYKYLAHQQAANCLEKLGLGEWDNDGHFNLIYPISGSTPIDLADAYQVTRHLTAKRLGGIEFLFPS